MNQQRQEMQRELSEGLQSRSIVVQFLNDHTLHLTLPSQEFFDIYNANIHANYQSSLTKVLSVISKFDKTVIHIIVHTDNTGTENYNRILSQHQANAVADFLNSHGVDNTRLRVEGRGEDFPLFSNESKEGRQHNRRIELFLKPIIEGKIDWAFWPPN
ncbi:MAG: OmpA family protein [Nitrospirales bacterium]|nr:OmpA family protein [Nitrospirales bacterium]